MKEFYEKSLVFTEDMVDDWCETHNDSNPLHTDEDEAQSGPFGERVVPGLMLLSEVSGMLTALGEDDETVILTGVTAARFRDPVFLLEQVDLRLKVTDDGSTFTAVEFEARVPGRDSLAATGVVSITTK